MVLNNRGYIYTITMVLMVLIIISLFLFYTQSSVVMSNDAVNRMQSEEAHYFVESVKSDSSRALSITLQRATAYSTDYVLTSNTSLENYSMHQCNEVGYALNGSQAAIAELMICGTFNGERGNESKYMENNTVQDWINRTDYNSRTLNYDTKIKLNDITIGMSDPYTVVFLAHLDILVNDQLNQTAYRGYDVPVVGNAPTAIMEDPLHYLKSGMPPLIRIYRKCQVPASVDGGVMDSWIDGRCYLPSDFSYNAPSFFDRLDGRINGSEKYIDQTKSLEKELNFTTEGIGLESLINLFELSGFNITVNPNNSQVDYLYWNNAPGLCWVEGMSHADFRIDPDHAREYKVKGLYCPVEITGDGNGGEIYTPETLTVPPYTTVYWMNKDSVEHTLELSEGWVGGLPLPPGKSVKWQFNEPGVYVYTCVTPGHNGGGIIIVRA